MGIALNICVVVLDNANLPVETVGLEPAGEFRQRHADELSFFFHGVLLVGRDTSLVQLLTILRSACFCKGWNLRVHDVGVGGERYCMAWLSESPGQAMICRFNQEPA